ncbi:MAG: DUF1028 domain-containing protein [Bacteroidota bacterium]
MRYLLALSLLLPALQVFAQGQPPADELVSTFSIVGYDAETGDLGIAVQSKFPNVRPIVPWLEAGVGAVATQSFAELDYGMQGLELMEEGATAEEALRIVMRGDSNTEWRQVGIVDAYGNAVSWTGADCFAWAGGRVGQQDSTGAHTAPAVAEAGQIITGKGYTVQGNILVSAETVDAMAHAYESTEGPLAEKLLAALIAGGEAGGDQRGEQSAALVVVREDAGYDGLDNYIDISVYDHPTPIAELARLYELNRLYFTEGVPENRVEVTPEIARELQEIWTERGFYDDEIDGAVDAEFKTILIDFMGWENYDMRIQAIRNTNVEAGAPLYLDRAVLDDIRDVFSTGRWKPKN